MADKRPNQLDLAVGLQLTDIITLNQDALPDKMVQSNLQAVKDLFADAGGDVVGPAGATNNAIARFDNTSGLNIQNSLAIIDDNGAMNIPFSQTYNINGFPLRQYVSNITDSNTPTELFLDGIAATQRLILPGTNTVWFYVYRAVGVDDGSGGFIAYEGKGMIVNYGGTITIYGGTNTLLNAQGPMVGSTVTASADNVNGSLKITVVDNSAGTQSNWNCMVDITQQIGI